MTDAPTRGSMYATISMAEILLSQNLASEAEKVIRALEKKNPFDPHVQSLVGRLKELLRPPNADASLPSLTGIDRVWLRNADPGLCVGWELTEAGLLMAKRTVRYSGRAVVRLFTAAMGQRGVRTQLRDIDISLPAGQTVLAGMPRPAVHAAAVGYLANTGQFVSCAQSPSLKVLS